MIEKYITLHFFIGYSGSSGTPALTNEEKEIIFFAAGVNKK